MQAAVLEADAEVLFERLGVGPGWRCLDLGCGVGGVTDLLSRRVGPAGHVVGLDNDPEKLEAARRWATANGLANVEFIEGDAYRTGLPPEFFDLVHIRFLFTTVGRHAELLGEALALARPGGTVAVQEADVVTLNCYPPHPAWDGLKAAIVAVFERLGGDTSVGRRMVGILRGAELEEVRVRPFVLGFAPEHPMAMFLPRTAESMREAILGAGLLSATELAAAIAACERHLAEPGTVSTSYVVFQVWGRKGGPAGPR